MLVITVTAAASCGAVWLAALVRVAGPRRRPGAPAQDAKVVTTREEDRVRPAVDADGAPIWVDVDHLFWHEIVSGPTQPPLPPRAAARETRSAG